MNASARRGEVRVSSLNPAERDAALVLLTRAFNEDPFMMHILEGNNNIGRSEALQALMDYSLAIREYFDWPILGLWDGQVLSGVAALSLPAVTDPWPQTLKQRFTIVKELLGLKGSMRLAKYSEISKRERPKALHIYLGVLGVDPAAQGRGFGKQLLDRVQDFSESYPGSTGVFLDTENPRNVPFYEHCGYEVISRHNMESVSICCLFRANRDHRRT
jgi:ribosomal protein S18 acetylase RimI-like enzyme